jgi:SAM-dependent methyltransferase
MSADVSRATPSFIDWDAAGYARARPGYPDALFDALAARCSARRTAWDCAAGSGQASAGLATRFDRVVATDLNLQQISAAPETGLWRAAANGLAAPFRDGVFDLVTVAQALHWFALPQFFDEVARVGSGGVFAAWSYGLFVVESRVDGVVQEFYDHLDAFWPPERSLVEGAYADIDFPFHEHGTLEVEMTRDWRWRDAAAYIATWSAVRRYRDAGNDDPMPALAARLCAAWGEVPRRVVWPVTVHLSDVP